MHPLLFSIPLPAVAVPLWPVGILAGLLLGGLGAMTWGSGRRTQALVAAGLGLGALAATLLLLRVGIRLAAVPVRSFGFFLALGLGLGILESSWLARRSGLAAQDGWWALFAAAPAALIGARVFYLLDSPEPHSALQALALGGGGLVGYGGLFGAALAGSWVLGRRRAPILRWWDATLPGLVLTTCLTRVGCYLTGCDQGSALGPGAPGFLVRLGSFPGLDRPAHPIQLYEAFGGLVLLAAFPWVQKRSRRSGIVAGFLIVGYAALRFAVELVRSEVPPRLFGPLSLNQVSALACLLAIGILEIRRQRAASST